MARFREIEFWPATGHRDRPWRDDLAEDAWVKSARRVSELYDEALMTVDLRGPVSSLRFFSFPAEDNSEALSAEVHLDRPEGWEGCRVLVPRDIAHLTGTARGRLVFELVDAALTELAPHRGWPLNALSEVREYVLSHRLEFEWASPWKTHPQRAHQARARFRMADDGYGRVVLEIRDRTSTELVARSSEAMAFSTVEGFKRSANTLRWVDSAATLVPYSGLLEHTDGHLSLAPVDGVKPLLPLHDDKEIAASTIPVRVVGTRAISSTPSIRVVGGGPTNQVPPGYLSELDRCLELVKKTHLTWWSAADRLQLEIWYSFSYWFAGQHFGGPEGTSARRGKDKLIARIHRDPDTINASPDIRQLARDDVSSLLKLVGDKMKLGPQPRFED